MNIYLYIYEMRLFLTLLQGHLMTPHNFYLQLSISVYVLYDKHLF